MPRKIKSYGRQDLMDVALPNHASTYTVISHKSVMDLSTEALEDAGFSVTAENYRATHDGNIASAIYTLNYGDDPELSMMFAWSNSYNKQMRFKCGVGAIHSVNNTSLVCGDMGSWARKHTGSADTETKETIEEQVKLAKMYYDQLVSDKESMKKINLDVRKQSQILGMLFAEHDILTTEQASMIKQQMSRPTYKCATPGTLWEFYNFVTIALQQSHPKTWMEDQRVLHWFISDTFKFDKVDVTEIATEIIEEAVAKIAPAATSDDQEPPRDQVEESEENEVNEATVDNKATVDTIPENSEEETKDPAQVDLVDSIAEVEAEQQAAWDQQTRIEEGLDHKGGGDDDEPVDDSPEITGIPDGDKLSDTDDEFDADAEMQLIKTELIAEQKRAEDKEDEDPVYDEDQIAELIKEDEAAVAEVCDEMPDKVAGPVVEDEIVSAEITDAEAAEIIRAQEAIDQQMAQEAAADNSVSDENIDDTLKVEPDFDLDFAPGADEEEDVQSGDVDFDFA